MTNYKSKRIIDGKPPIWVIVDETGKIVNKNPSKEELKDIGKEPRTFRDTNRIPISRLCCNCKSSDTYIKSKNWEQWHTCNCQKKICTKYICMNCYQRYDQYSHANIKKSLTDHRTGNLNPNCSDKKGDDFEELTNIWKGVKRLSIENDYYTGPLDHSPDSKGIIYQTKGKWFDSYNKLWGFGNHKREWNKEFDYEICYCASKNGKDIERIYEIPKKEIKDKRTGFAIYKNPMNKHGTNSIIPWYEIYRIMDEEELKKVNKIWKKIIRK
jgi:hypothetical protein